MSSDVDDTFGFNGKLRDNNFGSISNYDYGFRIYNPGIARFLSTDPLKKSYPWYTPYQFAGNMPIKYIDLDGLESAENPDNNKDVRAAKADVLVIAEAMNSQNTIENHPNVNTSLCGSYTSDCISGSFSKEVDGTTYTTDTRLNSAEDYNLWVNQQGAFIVDESDADQYGNYATHVVNTMMQNFIYGKGPENYIFPENGVISSKMLRSDIVQYALEDFKNGENVSKQYNFKGGELHRNLMNNSTPFNVDGFVGSGTITMVRSENDIKIEIFNMTSNSSGALTAKPPHPGALIFDIPKSYVRDNNNDSKTHFGNISQTFRLSIPYE